MNFFSKSIVYIKKLPYKKHFAIIWIVLLLHFLFLDLFYPIFGAYSFFDIIISKRDITHWISIFSFLLIALVWPVILVSIPFILLSILSDSDYIIALVWFFFYFVSPLLMSVITRGYFNFILARKFSDKIKNRIIYWTKLFYVTVILLVVLYSIFNTYKYYTEPCIAKDPFRGEVSCGEYDRRKAIQW